MVPLRNTPRQNPRKNSWRNGKKIPGSLTPGKETPWIFLLRKLYLRNIFPSANLPRIFSQEYFYQLRELPLETSYGDINFSRSSRNKNAWLALILKTETEFVIQKFIFLDVSTFLQEYNSSAIFLPPKIHLSREFYSWKWQWRSWQIFAIGIFPDCFLQEYLPGTFFT